VAALHEQRAEAASRIALLENSKAALLTQIGNLKIANRRETVSAAAAQQALSEVQAAANRYRDMFEAEHAELERYKDCLEEAEGQLNDSQREISEFRDILMQEVGGMALSADGGVDVTVFVEEYPTLDQMAMQYDQEPTRHGSSYTQQHSDRGTPPLKSAMSAMSAIKHATGERGGFGAGASASATSHTVSPADFSSATALTDDFGYSK